MMKTKHVVNGINRRRKISGFSINVLIAFTLLLLSSSAWAQVFDSGPSDSGMFDTVINLPPDPNIGNGESVHSSTQVNVADGGSVGRNFVSNAGSEVNISGGLVGNGFRANSNSEVNISDGSVGSNLQANSESLLNISGGSFGGFFNANSRSEVNISGGQFGSNFRAHSGSLVNISGGSFGSNFQSRSGEVKISGGSFGHRFAASSGSVDLFGGEFQLNGAPFKESSISLSEDDVFTGTLSDGSVFVFDGSAGDNPRAKLTITVLPTLDLTPIVVDSANPVRGLGLRAGQALTLREGGSLLANFEAVDATLNIEGGSLGDGGGVSRSLVNISGGSVGEDFLASAGSVVNISGGEIGARFEAGSGSVVNISGASVGDGFDAGSDSQVNIGIDAVIGDDFDAKSGSEVNISGGSVVGLHVDSDSVVNMSGGSVGPRAFYADDGGVVNITGGSVGPFYADSGSTVSISGGSVGDFFIVRDDSVVNISGGSIIGDFNVNYGGEVNLFGTEFVLDGTLLDSLTLGEAFSIDDRDVTLSALLADGSVFEVDLNSPFSIGPQDMFDSMATLTVTLVPEIAGGLDVNGDGITNSSDAALVCSTGTNVEASGGILGDLDFSGDVSFADFLVLSGNFGSNEDVDHSRGDVNCDGEIAFADFLILSSNFGQSAAAVATPEPGAIVTLLVGLVGLLTLRRRRS